MARSTKGGPAAGKEPIRVGMIRCDLHANYYAGLMEEHDPELMRADHRFGAGAYFYFYEQYNEPDVMTAPRVKGLSIAKIWDADKRRSESTARILLGKPEICESFEDVSKDVDVVFIADCNFNGADHLKLATPGLKRGVPTFVDKPLAYTVKDALAIVSLAEANNTRVLSLSMLRTLPHVRRAGERFAEVGGAHFVTIGGGGDTPAGQIHAISLAQHLFGNGVVAVEAMGRRPLAHVLLDYGDRPGVPGCGVLLNCNQGPAPHARFYVSGYGPEGAVHSGPLTDYEFPEGAARNLELIKEMVLTKKLPMLDGKAVTYEDMIENIAVAEAARLAQKERRRVRIDEVWKR